MREDLKLEALSAAKPNTRVTTLPKFLKLSKTNTLATITGCALTARNLQASALLPDSPTLPKFALPTYPTT